jgi:cobalamin biosynthesis Mg chelatase CobN
VHTATENRAGSEVGEREAIEEEEVEEQEVVEEEKVARAEERKEEVKAKVGKRAGSLSRSPEPAPSLVQEQAPKSAAARMAARRQAAQKTQRTSASLIVAENYGYVRRDLVFILILAIIMFSAIIALHFILGS